MTSEIHDALRDAQGVPEDEARRAAEVVVGFGDRLAAINTKLAVSDGKLDGVVEAARPPCRHAPADGQVGRDVVE